MLIYTMSRIDGVTKVKALVNGKVVETVTVAKRKKAHGYYRPAERGEEDCRKRNIC